MAALLEEAEEDLLAFYGFPNDHRPKLRSTNPLEQVNREIGRRTDVVGIFPNDRALLGSPPASSSNRTTSGSSGAATELTAAREADDLADVSYTTSRDLTPTRDP